ncbi:MAG: RNA polymerase-binding protein DksA [Candidatus Adiutrix intracellularis]|jgi:DnaK suppressor protein|nr:RNA polymerase-binding protein DksA [Candidatus Adiutrix intracellularis]
MDSAQQIFFKELLLKRRSEILQYADDTVTNMNDQAETYPDPTDRASIESDRNFILRLRERERSLLVKIDEALERIDTGEFGICETCGAEIGAKRLEARPVTTLCIDCKTRAEAVEKARGD